MKTAIVLILILLFFAWYLSFSASRLDRLHHRVETSWANLDAALQRRAAVALEIAHLPEVDPATNLMLTSSAYAAREADIDERSDAESALSESLKLLTMGSDLPEIYPELFAKLADVTERVRLAIAIHVESVISTRNVRKKLVFRVFRLAGTAPLPVKHAFEDDVIE
ncbi:MAG: hypothetical protein RJB28_671 [Actinomycetota bacterium]|jgi:hypothetical protein